MPPASVATHLSAARRPLAPRRSVAAGAVAAVALLSSGCGSGGTADDPPGPPNPPACTVTGVTVSASPATVNAGAPSTLTAALNASASCGAGLTWSAAPAGGMLTPSGATAAFTATTPGTYTVTATSTADPTRSGTATVTVTAPGVACGQPNGTVVTHAANVAANETWAGDGVTHVVPNSVSITGSAVVTIQPCAIVALGPGVTITVRDDARLVSAGASETRFVVFRRRDANQAWGTLRGISATSLIDLSWTRLQGGGGFGVTNQPTVAFAGVGYGAPPVAVLRAVDVTIEGSGGVGVFIDTNGAFTDDSRALTITGSTGRPVHTTMMSLGSLPAGTYTGNGTDEILIQGPGANVFANMTVEDRGVPVRIPFTGLYVGPAPPAVAPVTLTLRPGVVFRFPRVGNQGGMRMTFGTNGAAPNNLVGVLNAVGTAARPIVFTSGEAAPAPGDWVGIWLNTATNSRLDHVEISYAGGPTGIQSNNCRPVNTRDEAALFVGSFSDQYVPPANLITNSRITNSAAYAINAMWQASTFNAPNLTATNTFQNNARCRQTYNGLTPPGICPMNGGCTAP
jgi:hypothetical protein